jgi:predicted phosphodiesterase
MSLDRIAVVSDVHGNVTAYEAVLADLSARGIDHVVNLGDVAGKGPRGSEAIALTREHCRVTVRGNWDSHLVKPAAELDAASRWWRAELSAGARAGVAELPNCHDLWLSGRRVRFVHASATSEFVRVMFHHTDEQFDQMFVPTGFTGDGPLPSVVGYGDIHDTYLEVRDARTLFNAGSVGNALDEPTAAYAILEGVVGGREPAPFGLQFVRVPYDVEAEIAVACERGMPAVDAYAQELRTAVYRGRHDARV